MLLGNGVSGCTRGECTSLQHHQCPDSRACYDSSCIGTSYHVHLGIIMTGFSFRSVWTNILWRFSLLQLYSQVQGSEP